MNINLQCWYGITTLNLKVNDITLQHKIVDLLNIYYNKVIKISPKCISSLTWDFCLPRMRLISKKNLIICDNNKTLKNYDIKENDNFIVICDFNY